MAHMEKLDNQPTSAPRRCIKQSLLRAQLLREPAQKTQVSGYGSNHLVWTVLIQRDVCEVFSRGC